MKNKLRLRRAIKNVLDTKQPVLEEIPGLLGTLIKGKKRVKVNSRKSFVYVRLHGKQSETIKAFNDSVSILYDLPVLVTKVYNKGYNYKVTGKDVGRYQNWGGDTGQALLAPHGMQHSFGVGAGGSDIVWVYKRQFMPLLPYPYSGTSVSVSEDWYQWKDSFVHFPGEIVDVGAAKPLILGDARFVTLYLSGNTNTVQGITGSLFNINPFPSDVIPYIPKLSPSMGIPLTSILLTNDTENLSWNNLYDDYRPIYGYGGDSAYTSGTVSTVGQTLYLVPSYATVIPPITGSVYTDSLKLSTTNLDNVSYWSFGSPLYTNQDITLINFVNDTNDIRYIASGKWQMSLHLIVQHPVYSPEAYGGIYLELWTQDSSTGEETLISTSDIYCSENFKTGYEDYRHTFFGTILNDVSLSPTTRIFIRLKYTFSGVIDVNYVNLDICCGGNEISPLDFSTSFVFGGGHIIEKDGVIMTQRGYLNFVGDMFSVYDDGTSTVISGTAQDISLGLTSGSVPFVDGTGELTEDNDNFFWDNYSKQLYIGDKTFPFFSVSKFKVINQSGSAGTTFLAYEGVPYIGGVAAKGNKETPTAIVAENGLFWITATGYDGVNWDSGGTIKFIANQTWEAGKHGTRLEFAVVNNNSDAVTKALTLYATTAIIPGTLQTNSGGILDIISGSSLNAVGASFISGSNTGDQIIQDDGVARPKRNALNFVGNSFVTWDDAANNSTVISGTVSNIDIREKLSANRTYYVRTDGNDSNTGLVDSAAGAFLTIQKAVDVIANTLDIAGYTVTVQVRDGTYAETVTLKNVTGFAAVGNLIIQGNSTTPANVVIAPSSGNGIYGYNVLVVWDIKNLKINAAAASDLSVDSNTTVRISGVDFGACTNYHIFVGNGCSVICSGNYTISGNAAYHMWISNNGYYECINKTTTITANITVTHFVRALRKGFVMHYGGTFSLGAYSVTGSRYYGTQMAFIFTNDGGANYFPGSTAGSVDATSLYV